MFSYIYFIDFYRFKSDAADVEFVEKVARWLTNTQVLIKSEVASSNRQCQEIEQSIDSLQNLLDSNQQTHRDHSIDVI